MFDQAIEQFLMALSMDPDDADAHNNLGIAYVSKGLIDEGIKHYQIALSFSRIMQRLTTILGSPTRLKACLIRQKKILNMP